MEGVRVCRRIKPGCLPRAHAHWHYLLGEKSEKSLCHKYPVAGTVQGSEWTWQEGEPGQPATCPRCLQTAAKLSAA